MLQKFLGEKDLKTFIDVQDMCLDEEIALPLSGQHYSFEDASIMEFQELKMLGAGGYGEVQHVKDLRNGKEYARKVMVRPANAKRHHDLMHQFKRELTGMRRVQHRHCVTLRASFTDSDSVAILSTPVADMDLAAFLDLDLDVYDLSTLRKAIGCITAALSYLHEKGIRYVIML
jgi:serine/threonine protein kinase